MRRSRALPYFEIRLWPLGDEQRAERALRWAVDRVPGSNDARARLRAHYTSHGRNERLADRLVEDASSAADEATRAELLCAAGVLYADVLDDRAAAIVAFERAHTLAPASDEVTGRLASLLLAEGRPAEAVPLLRERIDGWSGPRGKELARYHHQLGVALARAGQADEAMEAYEAAFRLDLTNIGILRDLAELRYERREWEQAQKSYRALLLQRLGPETGVTKLDVYTRLAEIARALGDVERAEALFERARGEAPTVTGGSAPKPRGEG